MDNQPDQTTTPPVQEAPIQERPVPIPPPPPVEQAPVMQAQTPPSPPPAEQVAQTPPSPVDQTKPVQKRGFPKLLLLGIVVIILILVLGGTGYFILGQKSNAPTPTPEETSTQTQETSTPIPTTAENPTADWKTFTGKNYGYTLKYPNTLTANEFETPFYYVTFKRTGAPTAELAVFDLLAAPDTFIAKDPAAYDYLSADIVNDLMAMQLNSTKTINTSIFVKLPDITVAGQTATVVTISSTVDSTTHQKRVIFKNNSNIYMLINYTDDPNQQDDFNNFLSAFTFTN